MDLVYNHQCLYHILDQSILDYMCKYNHCINLYKLRLHKDLVYNHHYQFHILSLSILEDRNMYMIINHQRKLHHFNINDQCNHQFYQYNFFLNNLNLYNHKCNFCLNLCNNLRFCMDLDYNHQFYFHNIHLNNLWLNNRM